jgi:hypothetical protein
MQRNNLENMCVTVQYIVSFWLVVRCQLHCNSALESAAVMITSQGEFQSRCIRLQLTLFTTKSKL